MITYKENREVGSSDPGLSEFKAFALRYNSILPLYGKHTKNQKKDSMRALPAAL